MSTDYYVGLAIPPFEISAGEAYRKLKMDLTGLISSVSLKRCQQTGRLFGIIANMANDLERALLESYPILDRIKEELIKTGADIVRLTGSGPTVFALYQDKGLARKELARSFERRGWGFRVVKPAILPAKMIDE
jgi:4-diphosphocytidyl-2-C-methyl-D-erythritol kinase